PCDPDQEAPSVVYYQLSSVIRREPGPNSAVDQLYRHLGDMQANRTNTLPLGDLRALELEYFFYYPWDVGLNGHQHDLEHAKVRVGITGVFGGEYAANITDVIAAAHGVALYANWHHVSAFTQLPVTLFVEYGKHASAPDANGDGIYTPGIDVN